MLLCHDGRIDLRLSFDQDIDGIAAEDTTGDWLYCIIGISI